MVALFTYSFPKYTLLLFCGAGGPGRGANSLAFFANSRSASASWESQNTKRQGKRHLLNAVHKGYREKETS